MVSGHKGMDRTGTRSCRAPGGKQTRMACSCVDHSSAISPHLIQRRRTVDLETPKFKKLRNTSTYAFLCKKVGYWRIQKPGSWQTQDYPIRSVPRLVVLAGRVVFGLPWSSFRSPPSKASFALFCALSHSQPRLAKIYWSQPKRKWRRWMCQRKTSLSLCHLKFQNQNDHWRHLNKKKTKLKMLTTFCLPRDMN